MMILLFVLLFHPTRLAAIGFKPFDHRPLAGVVTTDAQRCHRRSRLEAVVACHNDLHGIEMLGQLAAMGANDRHVLTLLRLRVRRWSRGFYVGHDDLLVRLCYSTSSAQRRQQGYPPSVKSFN